MNDPRMNGIRRGRMSRRGFVQRMIVVGGAVVYAGRGRTSYAVNQGNIRLRQWYHEYGEAGTQEAAQRYAVTYTQENPNVEVEMVWNPGDYGAKLAAALLTAEGPDVFEGMPTVDMVKQGQVAPLDDLYTPEIKGDFNPTSLSGLTIDGKIYAVKMVDDTGLLYYRKSLLEQAGLQPPKTFDEVIAAATALNSGRTKGLFVGNDGGIGALLTIAPWSAGVEFVNQNNEITFGTERTAAAWAKVKELNDSGAILTGAPTDWFDPSAFNQNLVAMQWTGLWAMPAIQEALGDDFGVIAWPAFDAQGQPATFWGGWAEMVNGKSQNLEEAKKFVNWLWIERTDLQTDWNLSYGFHVPPRQSIQAQAEALKTGPAAEAVTIINEYGRLLPPTWTAAMGTAITDALSNIVNQGADPMQQVTQAAQTCTAEMQRVLS
ncbi:MAG: extracellular solute-binding protein [Chloroflexota bacterium]|nr:extracellular solute-binding protein [Chloroflexota bacterium]